MMGYAGPQRLFTMGEVEELIRLTQAGQPAKRLDASELANRLGVETTTIYRWLRSHLLPPAFKMAGRLHWLASDIDEWEEHGRLVLADPIPQLQGNHYGEPLGVAACEMPTSDGPAGDLSCQADDDCVVLPAELLWRRQTRRCGE